MWQTDSSMKKWKIKSLEEMQAANSSSHSHLSALVCLLSSECWSFIIATNKIVIQRICNFEMPEGYWKFSHKHFFEKASSQIYLDQKKKKLNIMQFEHCISRGRAKWVPINGSLIQRLVFFIKPHVMSKDPMAKEDLKKSLCHKNTWILYHNMWQHP